MSKKSKLNILRDRRIEDAQIVIARERRGMLYVAAMQVLDRHKKATLKNVADRYLIAGMLADRLKTL